MPKFTFLTSFKTNRPCFSIFQEFNKRIGNFTLNFQNSDSTNEDKIPKFLAEFELQARFPTSATKTSKDRKLINP